MATRYIAALGCTRVDAMRGSVRRGGVGAALAVAGSALLVATPTQAGGLTSAEITADMGKRKINFNRTTSVSGQLTTSAAIGPPPSPAGRTVTLYEKRYPYASEAAIATTTTEGDGSYEFVGLKPGFNAYYRVAVTEPTAATSEEVPVWVYPRAHPPRVRYLGGRRFAASFRMDFAEDYPVDLGGRPASWYFRKKGHSVARRIDRSKTHQPRPGLVQSKTRFRVRRGRYRFFIAWCFAVTDLGEDTGMGKPPTNQPCPRRLRFGRKGATKSASASPVFPGGERAATDLGEPIIGRTTRAKCYRLHGSLPSSKNGFKPRRPLYGDAVRSPPLASSSGTPSGRGAVW